MKILKFFLGILVAALFIWLITLVVKLEENEEAYLPIPEKNVGQAPQTTAFVDTILNDTLQENVSMIFDFKAVVEDDYLKIYQLEAEKFQVKIPSSGFKRVLSSDINLDNQPEFWLLFEKNNRSQCLGFQWEQGKLIPLNFPTIKGRQAFGYTGNDSLYLEKGLLVRDFSFANDPYAELSAGFRKCYYAFGKDRSFILKKTIDYEKR